MAEIAAQKQDATPSWGRTNAMATLRGPLKGEDNEQRLQQINFGLLLGPLFHPISFILQVSTLSADESDHRGQTRPVASDGF